MARWVVVAWQDIPVMVEATDETGAVTVPLSERFQALVDSAAMQQGLAGADAYLEQWQRRAGGDRPGTAREVAEAAAAELESRFTEYMTRAVRRA